MILGAHENDLILAAIGGLLICIASSLHLVIAGLNLFSKKILKI